jgi:hypothetical protein
VSSYVQVRAALLNKMSYICSIASMTIVDNAFASALPRSFRRYSFPVQMRTHTLCVCSLHGVNPLVITRSLALRTAPLFLHQAATINLNVSPMSGSSLSHVNVGETGESLLRRLAASNRPADFAKRSWRKWCLVARELTLPSLPSLSKTAQKSDEHSQHRIRGLSKYHLARNAEPEISCCGIPSEPRIRF